MLYVDLHAAMFHTNGEEILHDLDFSVSVWAFNFQGNLHLQNPSASLVIGIGDPKLLQHDRAFLTLSQYVATAFDRMCAGLTALREIESELYWWIGGVH